MFWLSTSAALKRNYERRIMKRILVIELLGGIGDILIALPAIKALATTYPHAEITVLTFAPGGELLEYDPQIHRVIYALSGQARQRVEQVLAEQFFDLIVSDTNYDKIDELIGQSNATYKVTNLWRNPPENQFVSDRFLQILETEGWIKPNCLNPHQPLLSLLNSERLEAKQTLKSAYRPLVVLVPDAGMSIKRWPAAHFVRLGQALQEQEQATILVSVGENPLLSAQITENIGKNAQILPKKTLRQLAAILAQADLVIAADTGVARISASLNVPTLTLFGPSWHGRYGQPHPHLNLQGVPDCPERRIDNFTEQPCWYSGVCPFEWENCTATISPETVLEAATSILADRPHPSPFSLPSPTPPTDKVWQQVKNLLVMRLDNIGDVIMTSPALRTLREQLPDAKITLMASPAGALTQPLLPWVDEVLPWRVLWQDLGRLSFSPEREWELIEVLHQQQFDGVIIFTSFSQSPHPAALVCYLAGIPLRLGESKQDGLGILTDSVEPAPDELHQVERNLRLIESVGFSVRDRRLSLNIKREDLLVSSPYILLNPWTTCQSRNYDPERFALAANELAKITGWKVVVTGVEKDRDRSGSILNILGDQAINLIGSTTLSQFAALVAHAQLILTNNTSTMHIADATRTPTVILFAGTELECQWQPRFAPVKLLRRPTVCNPCYAFSCPYDLECLDLPTETVIQAGLELLKT